MTLWRHKPMIGVRSGNTSNGFQIRFENKWMVSVQFGEHNYSEHHKGYMRNQPEYNEGPSFDTKQKEKVYKQFECDATSAEVWARHDLANADSVGHSTDSYTYYKYCYPADVIGWCQPDQIADFITKVKTLPVDGMSDIYALEQYMEAHKYSWDDNPTKEDKVEMAIVVQEYLDNLRKRDDPDWLEKLAKEAKEKKGSLLDE